MKLSNQTFKAAAYLRLSKEDADIQKSESDSISNQKALIRNFVKDNPDIEIANFYVDDGFTGLLFDRPAFQQMLSDVTEGKINCVIVKDLSRFGREYINAGKYMQQFFPAMGVRFIAINDAIDTYKNNDHTQAIMLSVKNLMNDNYSRDTSIKVRTVLEIKRQNGDFVTNFCAYGYRKCADNHNKIEPDEFSGKVVQDIFKWIVEGFSLYKIAEKLNDMGIKTPMDYRLENGERFYTNFKKNETSVWSHNIVKRIAENPVYIGTLIQGRTTTPNYKLKKNVVKKDMEEWAIIENNHEPLVDERTFYIVQRLLSLDMRTSPKQDKLYTFSGLVFCADCGAPMIRKTVPGKEKSYTYYVCSENKKNKTCSSHRISENILEKRVTEALRDFIDELIIADEVINKADNSAFNRIDLKKMQERINKNLSEIEKINSDIAELYSDYKGGMFTQKDFLIIKKEFEKKKSAAENAVLKIKEEIENSKQANADNSALIEEFKQFRNITEITRNIAVRLIRQIKVYEDGSLYLELDCEDHLCKYMQKAEMIKQLSMKEAI